MTKASSKNTKRALLSSIIALVLCFAMLIGTTFAWFTDSVTSSGNIIKSGTLDVTMEWADGTEALDTATWNDASTGAIFDYDLWEPGYAEVRHVRISNVGTLALKYALRITPTGSAGILANVIDVYYIKNGQQISSRDDLNALTPIGTLAEVLTLPETAKGHLRAGETDSVDVATIALKMRETACNDYQNLSIGSNFAVQLIATQYTYEEDSFDDQYDAAATLKFTVSDTTEINDALATAKAQNRGAYLLLDEDITIDNNATIPCLSNGGTTVYNLDGHTLTSTNQGAQYLSNGASLSFYNGSMELSAGNPLYANFLAQKNCSITAVDVSVESEGVPFMAAGDAAYVKVVRSTIVGGVYCVATNAGTLDNYGVIIDLKDSSFKSTAYSEQDNCAICLNVEGTLNIDNCDMTGGRQGVMVRAGTATIKNSEIKTLGNYTNKTQYYTGNWGSGNEVPAAALVVGNNPNRYVNYYADAVCTLSNTNIYADNDFAKIFIDSNTNTNSASYGQYSTKLTYSGGNVTSDMITAGPGTAVTIVDAN